MISVFKDKQECCGCSACESVCPVNAIKMTFDDEGFMYPEIDQNICINCNKCIKTCPWVNQNNSQSFQQKYYAVKNRDKNVVLNSSSGGFFTAISDCVFAENGTVFGAGFSENFKLIHMLTKNKKEQEKLRFSKYVQSNTIDVYKKVAEELKNNIVLFTGTPCQIDGLNHFLLTNKISSKNLITCDIICHGVTSPLFWDNYKSYLENKYEDKLNDYIFRSKKLGWKKPVVKASVKDKDISYECNKKYSYLNLFRSLLITRPCCFNCPYTNYERVSDITMADFWNLENSYPDFDDDYGVSLVMVNSKKGQEFFEKTKEFIEFIEVEKKDTWQPHLEYPNPIPKRRDKFWGEYNQKGIEYILNKYAKGTFMVRVKKLIIPFLKKIGIFTVMGKIYKKIYVKRITK